MTKIQELLGKILKNRINSELEKEKSEQNFAGIQETMDIFLAGDKITAEQYAEFTELINPTSTVSNEKDSNTSNTAS
ncbi:hypothetical protein [Clostridium saccharoperbutylacetonicum]|uniref:hypothetical protein n=1 Tax=Clostridium saccharoperbutylacetonicum TaxID=36745 RepID=UPI000983E53A|nr:hypothetical protein [Clostridium saccharoperbutylacetonicum]AQR93524.1 hypothetical protein CLSAP_08300 [Clostridium saccharoperbutylacetonicum]NSB29222.1 hypothetical protein [Clostridium saccharoperbutylacetonicum]